MALPVYKLGCRPPKVDERTLQFARYLAPSLPAPPSTCDNTTKLVNPGMMGNDRFGDCGPAALGHYKQVCTSLNGSQVTPSDADVFKVYSEVTEAQGATAEPPYSAFDPMTGANDVGVNELDMLKQYHSEGFYGTKLDAFAAVEHQSQREVMDAIYMMGGCLLGIALPLAWQGASAWTMPKHIPIFQQRRWAPGSWGGHAIIAVKYTAVGVWVISWGELIPLSWQAFFTYVQEAYALYDASDWVGKTGQAPNGFDAASLLADVQRISAA